MSHGEDEQGCKARAVRRVGGVAGGRAPGGGAGVVAAAPASSLVLLGGTVALGGALAWGVITYVERVSREFFTKGRDTVEGLHTLAPGLRAWDLTVLQDFY